MHAMRPIWFFSLVFGRRVSLVNRKADALENPFLALTTILPRSVLRDPYYYNGTHVTVRSHRTALYTTGGTYIYIYMYIPIHDVGADFFGGTMMRYLVFSELA